MTTLRFFAGLLIPLASLYGQVSQDWTHYVRIAGHGLRLDNADQIVSGATDTNVFGIEVDNDIPGRYESFLDPTEKLKAIHAVALSAESVFSATNRSR